MMMRMRMMKNTRALHYMKTRDIAYQGAEQSRRDEIQNELVNIQEEQYAFCAFWGYTDQ